jgi:hypothetical protein
VAPLSPFPSPLRGGVRGGGRASGTARAIRIIRSTRAGYAERLEIVPHDTDQKLKSYLDTNQLARERLCLAILALDKRFTDVRPRHPHGGRDGGIDIDAVFNGKQRAAAAIGFLIGANDSHEQKRAIKKKFGDDARTAIETEPKPSVFVFFTNVRLTITEQKNLRARATGLGFAGADIFDRERMRVVLDSVDGFAARFQYLAIPLSEAEQASFFARWGDDIQSVIATSFQRVERTLDRLLFLQEANDILGSLTVVFELDRTYDADEINHFRAFCDVMLVEEKHNISGMFFGSTDLTHRFYEATPSVARRAFDMASVARSGKRNDSPREKEELKSVVSLPTSRLKNGPALGPRPL